MSREEKTAQAAKKAAIKAGQDAYDAIMHPVEEAFYAAMKPLADACKDFDGKAAGRFREAEAAARETCRIAIMAAKAELHAARQESLRLYTEAAAPLIQERDAAQVRAERLRHEVERDTERGYHAGFKDGSTARLAPDPYDQLWSAQ